MPACLHCGEIAPDGALFCGNCGYTLPQPGSSAATVTGPATGPPPAPPLPAAPAPSSAYPPRATTAYLPASPYAVAGPPGAVGSIPAPPSAKYCVRCATLISRAAVYCPVCQQPQP